MLTCINCGAQGVGREGDTFACRTCDYTWDVQHEQANAVYLAGQGRRPAAPVQSMEVGRRAYPPETESVYGAWTVAELEAEVERRDLAVVGSGKNNRVRKVDLIAALEANDNG